MRVLNKLRGFNAAGSELGDELAIGCEEIILAEFAGKNPGDLFEGDGFDGIIRDGSREKADFEWFIAVSVFVLDAAKLDGFGQSGMKFLAKLAGECGFG